MKKWILHILLVGVLGILAASCSQEADDPTVDSRGEKEKVLIRFTIALDEPKAASRASWDGYDPDPDDSNYSDGPQADDDTEYMEIGSVGENYIDPNTVQVLIYDMNGTPMGELKEVTVKRDTGDDYNQHLYDLTGAFEADADQISSLDFKLMVFANTPKKSDLNNPDTWQFAYPLADGAGIPMWGIATFTGVDLRKSTSVDDAAKLQEPIYMLRSMAKIEVSLSKESIAAGYTLTSATLNKAMKNGIVMPKLRMPDATAASIKDLVATTALGIDEVFNPSTGETQANATFTGSDNTFYIYVPEYDVATEDDALQITLGFGDGNPKSFKHGSYSGGAYSKTPWDVVRNHYYKYEVTVNSGEDLEIIITIKAWNKRNFTYESQGLAGLTTN